MQRSRKDVKELRRAVRSGDGEALKSLLAHSLSVGHHRLSLCRYFTARSRGVNGLESFCRAAMNTASRMHPSEVIRIATEATRRALSDRKQADMLEKNRPLLPVILPYDGIAPVLKTEPRLAGSGSSILGKVTLGSRATLAPLSVIRADGHFVDIGDDFFLGYRSTVHIAHEVYPTQIGDRVRVGRNAVVHACTVDNDCVIEDDVIVLDGAEVESNILIEAGSTVYPRSKLLSGYVYAGNPAVSVRRLSAAEASERAAKIEQDIVTTLFAAVSNRDDRFSSNFVASTASLAGHVDLRDNASVFFSCQLDAGDGAIIVRDNTNIQDNTSIVARCGGVIIGQDTTIGHNVTIEDSRIGNRCLVGIGSLISANVLIDDDVLLAAGSTTFAGQHLESGWLYAGRPALPISKLNDQRREMMQSTVTTYCAYARDYQSLQQGRV